MQPSRIFKTSLQLQEGLMSNWDDFFEEEERRKREKEKEKWKEERDEQILNEQRGK